jgi:trimethylamine--corrinoid protein Co-methyltransferase
VCWPRSGLCQGAAGDDPHALHPFRGDGAAAVGGTLAQLNAEARAGSALAQMIEPGAPVIYGAFQTNAD